MRKNILVLYILAWVCTSFISAQEDITNAFDDLKRAGQVVVEDSKMSKPASDAAVQELLKENPAERYFYFTENRAYDIRMPDAIPECWTRRSVASRKVLKDKCAPGEFHIWQIGIFTPYQDLNQVFQH